MIGLWQKGFLDSLFSLHIDAFDSARIVNVCKSAEEILPKILKSMLDKEASQ